MTSGAASKPSFVKVALVLLMLTLVIFVVRSIIRLPGNEYVNGVANNDPSETDVTVGNDRSTIQTDGRFGIHSVERLPENLDSLRHLFSSLDMPEPGDWLDMHWEPGQTFTEFRRLSPPTAVGRVIYIQPLGSFVEADRAVVSATADFLQLYFQLPVVVKADWAPAVVPASARRRHPEWDVEQVLTSYVLYDLLEPNSPKDAAAYLALTAADLWPGRGWDFVFGEASIEDRVGVFSLHRMGGEPKDGEIDRLTLSRTLKTATHETCHMLSMYHCIAYGCNMGGSNSIEESDESPLALCPECLAKLHLVTNCDPVARYEQLVNYCRQFRLETELAHYESLLLALESAGSVP